MGNEKPNGKGNDGAHRTKVSVMRHLITSLFLFAAASLQAQNLEEVKKHVGLLASDDFFGRGYVNDGGNIAAEYLGDAFRDIGAKPIGETYFQEFIFDVNTYPEKLVVSCNGAELRSGYDFIVNPRSGSASGDYKVAYLDSTHFQSPVSGVKLGKKMPVVDLTGIDTPAEVSSLHEFKREVLQTKPVVVLNPGKLMWSVGQQVSPFAEIEVQKDRFCASSRKIKLEVKNEMRSYRAQNVVGVIPGANRDSCVVITAHYDHLGMMGDAIFPGASDNASGTAMMLDLMSRYASEEPEYDMVFIAFAGEEAGLVGSKYFVDHPLFDLEKVKMLINLDLMGSATEGIAVVNGSLYPGKMKQLAEINRNGDLVDRIKLRGKAANSDHYWFSEAGVPAVFIYTMGNVEAYHDVYDLPEGLDWAKYEEVFTLIASFIKLL
ncbi:MAG: M28 family metallopeptidase [Cryomorphaceae bacterium]